MILNYSPLEDRVLLRPIKKSELEITEGGIIDPNVKQKPVSKGEVISVGIGYTARETGVFVNTVLAKGDIVLYGTEAGTEIEIESDKGKETVRILREGDCILLISGSGSV